MQTTNTTSTRIETIPSDCQLDICSVLTDQSVGCVANVYSDPHTVAVREEQKRDMLVNGLSDENHIVRCKTLEALGKLESEVLEGFADAVVDAIVLCLNDVHYKVCIEALKIMGKLNPEVLNRHAADIINKLPENPDNYSSYSSDVHEYDTDDEASRNAAAAREAKHKEGDAVREEAVKTLCKIAPELLNLYVDDIEQIVGLIRINRDDQTLHKEAMHQLRQRPDATTEFTNVSHN